VCSEWVYAPPVALRVLDLALTSTRINQKGLGDLYKSGVFEMLLWKLLAGDIWKEDRVRIAKFLWRTHLVQVSATRPFAYSLHALRAAGKSGGTGSLCERFVHCTVQSCYSYSRTQPLQ